MEKEMAARNPHILVLPFPAQGHINPILAFSKCLASKGINITIITTTNLSKSAQFSLSSSSISIQVISDGSEDLKEPESNEEYFKRFKNVFSQNLSKLIDEQISTFGCVAKVIIYDSIMPWVLNIAHQKGLLGASFFTQSCAVSCIYYHVKQGLLLQFPYEEDCVVSMPSMPILGIKDLPSLTEFMDPEMTIMNILADQFSNLEKVDWIFFNTFDKLENEVVNWMSSRWPGIKTIGPTISLPQKDMKLSNKKNHMISMFEPSKACIEWLDSRETNSVIYVSFGSVASLGKEQMEEFAFGLMMSNCYFLWVIRSSEEDKIPPNLISKVSADKGLVVNWCSQPEVLAHRAVSCFMTHCGWNSTIEALSFGVPLIAVGQWVDQTTNAKFIEDVWNVGVRVKGGENGILEREEIAKCVREVMHGEKGEELKRNGCKWKELAKEAVEIGGSSAKNVEDFVSQIL